jgi:peptidoglycan/LPS O-acetylase OafA/YrhL
MGSLRLLLAVCVVLSHTGPIHGFAPLGGVEAVQTFYMISGFYMALILSEKYTGAGAYRLFLANRLLRIYPTYWVVLLISAVVWWIAGSAVKLTNPLSIPHAGFSTGVVLLLVATNLLLLGQDVVMFSGVTGAGNWRFSRQVSVDRRPLWRYLLVPQAWSLSIELMFYAVAPFMVRWRTRSILITMLLCAALRGILYKKFRLHYDPWTYRFAPTELLLFLAGVLAYRLYRHLDGKKVSRVFCKCVAIAILLLCLVFTRIPMQVSVRQWGFYCVVCAGLPFMFLATRSSKIDRLIGELSYPLYLSHALFLTFLPALLQHLGFQLNEPVAILVTSVIFSMGLDRLVIVPIERVRRRIAARLRPPKAGITALAS